MNLEFTKKHLGFLCVLLLVSSTALAQKITVRGTVRDQTSNEPIIGAAVIEKGAQNGAVTSLDGTFSLEVPPQATLEVSSISYTKAEVQVQNRSVLTIGLKPDSQLLSEVVVVGYGVQKKSLVTGAITSVGGKEFERPGMLRSDDVLQGKAAGVTVMANSGQPGEKLSIRIRGAGTNGNPSPLFIVDGQPMDDIVFLNPRDIESMEVLKDAASSAIYGARGANGVVIITTRRGKLGERMAINYDFSYGIQNIRKKMSLLNAPQYMLVQNEAAFNSNAELPFSKENMDNYNATIGKGTDWQEEILYVNAPSINHQLSLTGGSEKTAYNISASYLNQDGIFAKDKSNYERITLREGTDHVYFGKFLKVGQSIVMTHVVQKGIDPNNIWGGPILGALNMDPMTTVFNPDGTFAESKYVSQEVVNPVAKIAIVNNRYRSSRIIANAYGELHFTDYLNLRSTISSELYFDDNVNYTPVYRLNSAQINLVPGVDKATSYAKNMLYENVLTFNRTFDKHTIQMMVGNTLMESSGDNLFGAKKGLLIDNSDFAYLDLAKNEESAQAAGGAWHNALVSYFGRANYSYDERYMLTATFRADGSTRFGKNNRFGYFPSVSVGWNISNESFFKSIQSIDLLKFRASWGQNGNDRIGDWQFLPTIATDSRGYTFNNVIMSGASPAKVANPDLKWETSEQTNLGMDIRFLHKFTASVDYYVKNTKDLLIVVPIPTYVGAPAPAFNAGSIRNSGIEFAFGYRDSHKDFRWNVDFNLSYNKNRVTKVGNNEGWIGGASVGTAMTNVTRMAEGLPISYFWGYETNGVFQNDDEVKDYLNGDGKLILPDAQAGDFRFVDLNGDGKMDDNDRTKIGDPNPDFTSGLTLGLAWNNFDVSAFFVGMFGQDVFNATRRWDLPMSNYQLDILDRWYGEGTSNDRPRLTTLDPNKNYSRPSRFFLEDGSFVRLRNVTLGYTSTKLEKYYINKLRVYVSASNLFLISGYSGLDPEVGSSNLDPKKGNNNVLSSGIDYGMYPQPRTFMFGVNLTF